MNAFDHMKRSLEALERAIKQNSQTQKELAMAFYVVMIVVVVTFIVSVLIWM